MVKSADGVAAAVGESARMVEIGRSGGVSADSTGGIMLGSVTFGSATDWAGSSAILSSVCTESAGNGIGHFLYKSADWVFLFLIRPPPVFCLGEYLLKKRAFLRALIYQSC